MTSLWEKNRKYYSKNPMYNSIIHILFGIGIGFLTAYPMAGAHPVRWGAAFISVSLLGMLMAGKW